VSNVLAHSLLNMKNSTSLRAGIKLGVRFGALDILHTGLLEAIIQASSQIKKPKTVS